MSAEKKKDVFVTVVAPIVGGAQEATQYVTQVSGLLSEAYTNYEIILVEGDADVDVVNQLMVLLKELPCIRIIRLSQVTNRDVMLFAGFEAAIGDFVVAMTPPTDPPRVITDLVDIMSDGQDIVFGISNKPVRGSLLSSLGAKMFYWYGRRYLALDIPPNATYLVGLNRRSINALTRIKGRYRHVRHLTRQVGFKSALYRYTPDVTTDVSRERSLAESLRLAKEIVVSYSYQPLRAVSALGLIASAANLLYALYVISNYFFNKHLMEGWTTMSLELAVMFFLLFVIMSVVCEYLGRILEETRAQPAYHIMEELNSTVLVADETRRNVTT